MTDPYLVLVTGSRFYAGVACIRRVLAEIAGAHPACELGLMNGMCDPRRPGPKPAVPAAVPWQAALRLSPEDQLCLLGGDWLSDRVAEQAGCWRILRRPADWERHGRKRAGFIRNGEMVAEAVANGAADGKGECVAFTGPCESAHCRITVPHESHGTTDCIRRARKARIPVRLFPPPVQATPLGTFAW